MSETGIISIRGRQYKTVALRISEFRKDFPDWTIRTEILERTEARVLIRAEIISPEGRLLADGYAEEDREASMINKVSAVENCATSAIGRALASFGYVGSEFATEEDIAAAKQIASVKEEWERARQHTQAFLDYRDTVFSTKSAIQDELSCLPVMEREFQIEDVARAWYDMPQDIQAALNRAPTKGGVFSTAELSFMKNNFRRLAFGEIPE